MDNPDASNTTDSPVVEIKSDITDQQKCCVHCASTLPKKANFCTKCSKSQNRFQSTLFSIAGVSAAITFFAGAAAYIAQSAPIVYESYYGGDIDIVSFKMTPDAMISLSVSNPNSKPVLIGEIQFFFPNKEAPIQSLVHDLGVIMEGGSLHTVQEEIKVAESYNFPHAKGLPTGWKIDGNKLKELQEFGDCFRVVFVESSGHSISTILSFYRMNGTDIIQVEGEAWIRFFSTNRGEWFEKDLEAMAVLLRKPSSACQGLLSDIPASGNIYE